MISIHALRGEGDPSIATQKIWIIYFYPRPPWGGRLILSWLLISGKIFLSTPSVGRATILLWLLISGKIFLSTPSVGRATIINL